MKFRLGLWILVCLLLPLASGGSAQFVTNQYTQPSFSTYYGGSIGTYWPILNEREQCLARQDILLQVAPAGCQPSVVRSDLLAEQNVPVFCQLNALQVNPLLNIKELETIRFIGNYPPEVSGVGFHPARAALRTRDQLLGDPLLNNVGYVVVVLKKQPKESSLPGSVKLTLSAQLRYDGGNALGAGRSEFLLAEQSDPEWVQAQKEGKQSFFNGMYQVRLEDANAQGATIGIYSGVRKIGESQLERGKQSPELFLPGSFCRAGIRAELLGYELGKERATLRVTGGQGSETIDVYQGSSFLQGQCRVTRLFIDNRTGRTGSIDVKCAGAKAFSLKLLSNAGVYEVFAGENGDLIAPSPNGEIDFGQRTFSYQSGKFRVGATGVLEWFNQSSGTWIERRITGTTSEQAWYRSVLNGLQSYMQQPSLSGSTEKKVLREKTYPSDVEANFTATIEAYRLIAVQYPAEKGIDLQGIQTYGEQALYRAASLAGSYGKQSTQAVLLQELLTTYPDSLSLTRYQQELDRLSEVDGSQASAVLSLQNVYRTITLVSVTPAVQTASARLQINNEPVTLTVGQNWTRDGGFIRLSRLEAERATFETNCAFSVRTTESTFVQEERQGGRVRPVFMSEFSDGTICGRGVRIAEIDSEKLARVRLTTTAERTETTTNFTVQIGIEKRAIQLSPAKTAERIGNLNKSIQKWEQLNKNLGKVVTSMKAACFATAGVLTVKNFFAGLSGKGFARKETMQGANGWTAKCRSLISEGKFRTLDQCYSDPTISASIEADVAKRDGVVKQVNAKITDIQKQEGVKASTGFFDDSINTDEAAKRYRTYLKNTYGSELTFQGIDVEYAGYTELRETHMNLLLAKEGGSDQLQKDVEAKLKGIGKSTADQKAHLAQLKIQEDAAKQGGLQPTVVSANSALPRFGDISPKLSDQKQTEWGVNGSEYYTDVVATQSNVKVDGQTKSFGGAYRLGLTKQADGTFVTDKVYRVELDGKKTTEVTDQTERAALIQQYNLGSFKDRASSNWEKYKWDKPRVQYYESDPHKGLPALVPVDPDHGWYAATKPTLPAFGGLAGWESSGRVASFYLCNVGENKLPDVFNGYSDDSCTLINLGSNQAADKIPGVSETRAMQLVKQAREALEEAARAHKQGAQNVLLKGKPYPVDKPAVPIPGVQCQDYMSPTECNLLFNVCDPVICPASRCDFGGKYPVQDVIQTGIIGSTLLCMPNFPEVKIPLCLSGVHAGIDAYTKILQAHRDCLQESLTSGRMVGICDQIYSIYTCEFFWRQLSPIANLLVPKLLEQAQGQGARGGGEYLTVQNAWQNAKQSTDYLTTTYGVNAFKAFQVRSTEEVGGEVCKGFASGTFPGSFKSLVQPDSPVQFHAYFSSIRYTEATVPATSQYKVFYHIYAGKDQGVSYRVYLKNPPATSYYASQPTLPVSSGFIGKGQFKDETRDFTAPEGYQELCVVINGNERCGFKQVSTSFAVNQLRDAVVSDELKNTQIASEQACVSGTVSASALLNPNLNQMADEAADPALYRRGIIRVCATGNPGQTTDPSRFVDVGYCGDRKLRCWLDKQSIQNAITDVNVGVKNATYEWFANQTFANLQKDGRILDANAGFSELTRLEGVVGALEQYQGQKSRLSPEQSTRLSQLFLEFGQTKDALFFNHHRARLGWLVGRAQEVLFKHVFAVSADDTRQAGQLDKGILVRENKGTWEVKADAVGRYWYPLTDYLDTPELAVNLSYSQLQLLEYINTADPEEAHFTLLGGSGMAQGVTVTSTNYTEQAYYYVPYGDAPSTPASGGTPAGTPTSSLRGDLDNTEKRRKTEIILSETDETNKYGLEEGKMILEDQEVKIYFLSYSGKILPIYFFGSNIYIYSQKGEIDLESLGDEITIGTIKEDKIDIDFDKISSLKTSNKIKSISNTMNSHLRSIDRKIYSTLPLFKDLSKIKEYTYELAIQEAQLRKGKPSDSKGNEEFVRKLRDQEKITEDEYKDIIGKGPINREKDMAFLAELLIRKKGSLDFINGNLDNVKYHLTSTILSSKDNYILRNNQKTRFKIVEIKGSNKDEQYYIKLDVDLNFIEKIGTTTYDFLVGGLVREVSTGEFKIKLLKDKFDVYIKKIESEKDILAVKKDFDNINNAKIRNKDIVNNL